MILHIYRSLIDLLDLLKMQSFFATNLFPSFDYICQLHCLKWYRVSISNGKVWERLPWRLFFRIPPTTNYWVTYKQSKKRRKPLLNYPQALCRASFNICSYKDIHKNGHLIIKVGRYQFPDSLLTATLPALVQISQVCFQQNAGIEPTTVKTFGKHQVTGP